MRHLLRALARTPDPLSDAALLARFNADRDPAAFEVLVWRHGGMVLGVCRRHLRDGHAAEDAFQATFLILARKASTIRGDTLAGWLHRVARRAATRAVAKTQRRRETALAAEPPARSLADGELSAVLDAEIDRLPERLRQVVVLCYLDGESTEAAAARLGIPRGTVLSRLHTARATLAGRLTRRGVAPPAVGLTAVLTAEQVAGGVRAAGDGFGPSTILANEVLAMSGRKTVLAVAVGLLLAGGAGTGIGMLSAQSSKPAPATPPPPVAQAAAETPEQLADRTRRDQFHRLSKSLEQVENRLDETRRLREFLHRDSANQLGPAALHAALLRLDEHILLTLYPSTVSPVTDRLPPHLAEPRPDFSKLTKNDIWRMTISLPEVGSERAAWEAELQARDKLPPTDTAARTTAEAKIEEARVKLERAMEPHRDKAIKQSREYWARIDEADTKSEAVEQRDRMNRVAVLEKRRAELVRRVTQADKSAASLRRLDDEEKILIELRAAFLRQRSLTEFGIALPAATSSP